MCEAMSPPLPGDESYIAWPQAKGPHPKEGESFTEPWGWHDVTFRVVEDRGPGKLTGSQRLRCEVQKVSLAPESQIPRSGSQDPAHA